MQSLLQVQKDLGHRILVCKDLRNHHQNSLEIYHETKYLHLLSLQDSPDFFFPERTLRINNDFKTQTIVTYLFFFTCVTWLLIHTISKTCSSDIYSPFNMFKISSPFNIFPLLFLEGEIHGSILLVFLVSQQFQ